MPLHVDFTILNLLKTIDRKSSVLFDRRMKATGMQKPGVQDLTHSQLFNHG